MAPLAQFSGQKLTPTILDGSACSIQWAEADTQHPRLLLTTTILELVELIVTVSNSLVMAS